MSHLVREQYLRERLLVLEDLSKSSDDPGSVMVCNTCFTQQDPVGCLCGQRRWTLLHVVILQIRLDMTQLHIEAHTA